jgi:tetratricopeptide (TPR) repeat protein
MRRWAQAKCGDGQVVLISGEPGIGKSRIAQTILERISSDPHTRLRYFCSPHHQDSALYPSIAQLERAAGFRREDTAEQRIAKLEAVLAQGTNDLSEAVPLLADLLSIPTGDRYPPLNLTPQKRKEKTLHAQLAQVEGLAAGQPVLMVWEDVHWSDPTTRESLDLLVERVPTLRVLVILTFRPEFTPPWIGRPHVMMLTLNRLPRRQGAEMIAHVTGGKALPKEISDQIVDRTDGVPLFIEELTKTVVESGIVTEAGDHYAVAGPMAPLAIPTSLHASLLARLDRLAPTREVAQIGAALGRSFSHELISAISQMPRHKLDDALELLVRAELIFRRGTPPEAEYTFKHALVQDTAYSTLLRSRRHQLHARIAATLEAQFPEAVAAQPELLAHHCTEAANVERAIEYWLKAGQLALARSAIAEAVGQLRRALDMLAGLPDDSSRRQRELDLLIALRPALAATKGMAAAAVGETIARARALAEQMDRPDYLVRLTVGQWAYHLSRSEHNVALSMAEELQQIGRARNDVGAQLRGGHAQGVSRLYLGNFVAARALLEQCLNDQPLRGVHPGASEDPHSMSYMWAPDPGWRELRPEMLAFLAVTLAYLGHIDQARSGRDEALSEARRLHAITLASVLLLADWVDLIARLPECLQHADELLALSTEHDFPLHVGWATVFRGRSLTMLGQTREGLALITQGLAAVRFAGTVANTPHALMWLAEANAMIGLPVEGLNCLAQAAKIIESNEERLDQADLHRLYGDLLNATGDQVAAEENYHRALAVARRQSAKSLELHATTDLARLWRDQGKRAEARDLLAPIYGWFTEGFDTPVLKEAKALLDQLT